MYQTLNRTAGKIVFLLKYFITVMQYGPFASDRRGWLCIQIQFLNTYGDRIAL